MKRRSKATKKAKARSSKVKARRAVAKAKSSKKPRFLKPKRSAQKKHSKPVKSKSRVPRAKVHSGQSMVSEPLEQVIVTCANCGRQFTVVKLPGLSLEGMICQRCELGEIAFPE